MATAKDYILAVTGLTNTIWIAKPSKKDANVMTNDRRKVDDSEFIGILLQWTAGSLEDNVSEKHITLDDVVIATITLHRDKMNFETGELIKPKPTVGDEVTMYFKGGGATSEEKHKILAIEGNRVTLSAMVTPDGKNEEENAVFSTKTGKCVNDNTHLGFSRSIDPIDPLKYAKSAK